MASGRRLKRSAAGRVFDFDRSTPTPVLPLSDTEFYADSRSSTCIAFTVDAAGKVLGAVLNPGRGSKGCEDRLGVLSRKLLV